jgi:hypothetical protein
VGIELPLETWLALAIRQIQALGPDVVCLQEVRPTDPIPYDFASLIDGRAGRTAADVITARSA